MSNTIPTITESSRFNFITSIWIVPFIALVIAGWLAFQYFSQRGAQIKIIFPKNEGLVAGQSLVKFRNVPVGKVTKIYVEEGTNGVIVVVRMNSKNSTPYLNEHANFWIVKPEVGISGVSGLDTLISGTYINVHSKAGGQKRKESFIGLTQPYRDTGEGEYFRLQSSTGEGVQVGTPILYKNIKIGQVAYLYLGLDNTHIEVIVFIDNQYLPFVENGSKFWIKSSLNLDFSKGNLDMSLASFQELIQGGIVLFSSGDPNATPPSKNHIFTLYKNQTDAESKLLGVSPNAKRKFMIKLNHSLANLKVGSVVRFDGFDIGRVEDIELFYNKNEHKMHGEVRLEIDTSVFQDKRESNSSGLANFYEAIESGLRAKITSLDPITQMKFIDLTFEHSDGNASVIRDEKYVELPVVKESEEGIMVTLSQILDKINQLPLEGVVNSLQQVIDKTSHPIDNANRLLLQLQTTVKNINRLTGKKSFEVLPDELNKAIKQITTTLKSTQQVLKGYGSNSLAKQQLAQTLEVLTQTSKEMQLFLRMLNRKPNSLIFGDD